MTHQRFARLKLILGDEGLEKLAGATVMVTGLGGVGSSCAEALARGGVGTLILIDRDVIEESNINRQALAFVSTVGKVKAQVMEAMVADINPDCTTYARNVSLNRENLSEVFAELPRPDYVIDCIDDVTGKIEIAQWCAENRIHLVSSMGGGNKLDPSYLKFAKVNKTQYCPLAKVIRQVCIRRRIRGLEVLYSSEVPVHIEDKGSGTKAETVGTMSYFPPIMGQMLAGKVIRRLVGLEETPLAPRIGGPADASQPPTES
ncbi:tRNA A37 threonylcarbamoyladenosine dehydratase [Brevibacterium paucivorans]|uniref:tRNA A37 threonylcarbamoyladenosine dehydratase n=1 Tax=Brevibacterium paucivorans TaxID=170994 RepID=A0ABS2SKZ5_9MICO|nr:tRNA threonylcarbamoyladenosine dehydratase [Brevibacterium paucivorans]MBM7816939.1 tRNA A37 threonylcarbamoyladenosine dehydratase [Brevibacterium paucivorans]